MKKLERSGLLADRKTISGILAELSADDVLGQMSLESRLADIDKQLLTLEDRIDTAAGVALMFGGKPVHGSRGIDADFATKALENFQNLVRKRAVLDEVGSLGERGPIPASAKVDLEITEFVRGSVGFLLEESIVNDDFVDTPLKLALSETTSLIAHTASEDPLSFEEAVETLDHRLLVSLREFFRVLDTNHATISIIEESKEARLDRSAIQRGRERVDTTEIEESESETIVGELLGLLPESRRFEMKLLASDQIIRGTVIAKFSAEYRQLIEDPNESPVGRNWRTKMKIREVRERNKPPRKLYTLIGLMEEVSSEHNPRLPRA